MILDIPCRTEECAGAAVDGRATCVVCHDRNGYPHGYSRAKDEAWLDYRSCSDIRVIPLVGPGCNSHPVTPRSDMCPACLAVAV